MTSFIHVEQPLAHAGVERVRAAFNYLADTCTRLRGYLAPAGATKAESAGEKAVSQALGCAWDQWRPIRDVDESQQTFRPERKHS